MKRTTMAKAAIAAGAAFLLASSPVGAAELKIAVVHIQKILNECDAGKKEKVELESRFAELKKKVDAKEAEARKLKDDLDKQKVVLGKEKVKKMEEDLQAKVKDFQKLAAESQKEMEARQEESQRKVLVVIEKELDAYIAEQKIDLMLDKVQGGVLHTTAGLDVTEAMLERVNKALAQSAPPAPAAPAGK